LCVFPSSLSPIPVVHTHSGTTLLIGVAFSPP
jgi:hypothetical protein